MPSLFNQIGPANIGGRGTPLQHVQGLCDFFCGQNGTRSSASFRQNCRVSGRLRAPEVGPQWHGLVDQAIEQRSGGGGGHASGQVSREYTQSGAVGTLLVDSSCPCLRPCPPRRCPWAADTAIVAKTCPSAASPSHHEYATLDSGPAAYITLCDLSCRGLWVAKSPQVVHCLQQLRAYHFI